MAQMDSGNRNQLLASGKSHLAKKEYQLALEDFEKVIEIEMSKRRKTGRARGVLSVIAQYFVTCREIREPELAFKYIENYEELLSPCDVTEKVQGFFEVGLLYMQSIPKRLTHSDFMDKTLNEKRHKHFELASQYFQKGLDVIIAGVRNPVSLTRNRQMLFALKSLGLQYLGILLFQGDRYDDSIYHLRKAIETHQLLGKKDLIIWKDWCIYIPYKCYKHLCLNYLKMGPSFLSNALQQSREAVKFADKLKDLIWQVKSRVLVAKVHFQRVEVKEGADELAVALAVLQGTSGIESTFVAVIHHKYHAALAILESMEKLKDDMPRHEKIHLLEVVGDNYYQIANMNSAKESYLTCAKLIKYKPGDNERLSRVYTSIGCCQEKMLDFTSAVECYQEAMKVVQEEYETTSNVQMTLRLIGLRADIAYCKHRAREIQNPSANSTEDIIKSFRIVLDSEPFLSHQQKLRAFDNYIKCLEYYEMTQELAIAIDEKRAWIDLVGKSEEEILTSNDGNALPDSKFEEDTGSEAVIIGTYSPEGEGLAPLQFDSPKLEIGFESDVPSITSSWSLANDTANTSMDDLDCVGHAPVDRSSVSETDPVLEEVHEQDNKVYLGTAQLKRRRLDLAGEAGPSSANISCDSLDSAGLIKTEVKMESEPELQVIFSSFEQSFGNTRSETRSNQPAAKTSLKRILRLRVVLKSKDICIVIPLKPEDLRKNVTWLRMEVERMFRELGEVGVGESIKYLTTKDKAILYDKFNLEDLIDEANSEIVAVVNRLELSA